MDALKAGRVIILDLLKEKAEPKLALLKIKAEAQNICINSTEPREYLNYSKGEPVKLILMRATQCPAEIGVTSETLDEKSKTTPGP